MLRFRAFVLALLAVTSLLLIFFTTLEEGSVLKVLDAKNDETGHLRKIRAPSEPSRIGTGSMGSARGVLPAVVAPAMAKMESTLQGFSHAHGVDENGGSSGSKEDVVSAAGHEALQTYNWVDSDVFESQVRSEQLRARKEEGETNDKGSNTANDGSTRHWQRGFFDSHLYEEEEDVTQRMQVSPLEVEKGLTSGDLWETLVAMSSDALNSAQYKTSDQERLV